MEMMDFVLSLIDFVSKMMKCVFKMMKLPQVFKVAADCLCSYLLQAADTDQIVRPTLGDSARRCSHCLGLNAIVPERSDCCHKVIHRQGGRRRSVQREQRVDVEHRRQHVAQPGREQVEEVVLLEADTVCCNSVAAAEGRGGRDHPALRPRQYTTHTEQYARGTADTAVDCRR